MDGGAVCCDIYRGRCRGMLPASMLAKLRHTYREFGSLVCKLPRNRFFRTDATLTVAGFVSGRLRHLKLMLEIEVCDSGIAHAAGSAAIPDLSQSH